tara:strand:+ start:84 stop:434 length:351 start_codon:yes stop_codon:yes gene_type:complete
MTDINQDMQYLQVTGINQFKKEFEQQKQVVKNLDFNGLHRNELTEEIEGYDLYIRELKKSQVKEQAASLFNKISNGSLNVESNIGGHESPAKLKKQPLFKHSDINYNKIHINEMIE